MRMAYDRSLLERIRDPQAAESGGDVRVSILRHLQQMLNTRQGGALTVSDYGIPALSDIGPTNRAALLDLRDAIRATIAKYEPRLSGVRVALKESEAGEPRLRFDIFAVLADDPQRSLWFETQIDSTGSVRIRD